MIKGERFAALFYAFQAFQVDLPIEKPRTASVERARSCRKPNHSLARKIINYFAQNFWRKAVNVSTVHQGAATAGEVVVKIGEERLASGRAHH